MNVADLLLSLVELDVVLWTDGDRLRFRAPAGVLDDDTRASAARCRGTLRALVEAGAVLHADRAAWPDNAVDAFEERAAIMEFDGGLTRAHAERVSERLVRGMMREGFAMRGEIGAHTKLADLDITIVVPPGWVAPSDAAAVAVAAWCALRERANCRWMVNATHDEAAKVWERHARECAEHARTMSLSDDAGCMLRDERRAAAVANVIRSRPDAWRAVLGLLADSDSESYGARLYALMDGAYPGWRELPAADDCARKARGDFARLARAALEAG